MNIDPSGLRTNAFETMMVLSLTAALIGWFIAPTTDLFVRAAYAIQFFAFTFIALYYLTIAIATLVSGVTVLFGFKLGSSFVASCHVIAAYQSPAAASGSKKSWKTAQEQGRNALGQFTKRLPGQKSSGSSAVNDFIKAAERNGHQLVGKEVQVQGAFGPRRYDVVFRYAGANTGYEIKSSESAFSRLETQQFANDRWMTMIGGKEAVGKFMGVQVNNVVKLQWEVGN